MSMSLPSAPTHELLDRPPLNLREPKVAELLPEALKIIPNEQTLINVVSQRVRQLNTGHRPLVMAEPRMTMTEIALKEIAEDKLGWEAIIPEDPPQK